MKKNLDKMNGFKVPEFLLGEMMDNFSKNILTNDDYSCNLYT
ncbi:hypothetical protein [Wukongibacter baidiensis]